MALYLGNQKINLNLNDNKKYKLSILIAEQPLFTTPCLLTKDGYKLKDCNNFYLTIQEDK